MNSMPQGAFSSQQYRSPPDKRPHGYAPFSMNQYAPQQQALFGQEFANVSPDSYLGRLAAGDESFFAEQEAPALRQFNELQGNIASRFSGQGLGARRSSGFQNTMSAASQDFAGQLQANRQNMRRQAILDLMGLSDTLLSQRPTERGLVQKPQKKGGWGETIGTLFGGAAGMFTGDYGGAAKGATNVASFAMGA
jgi:hypothetical protein